MADDPRESERSWGSYYAATAGRPARPTLLRAIAAERAERARPAQGRAPFAVDLGCGWGRDSLPLLAAGWRVLAIDAEAEALERSSENARGADRERLASWCADIAVCRLPRCDLVNASFVLPFLTSAEFAASWARIGTALAPGGRFAGQLFGPRDSWVLSGRCLGWSRSDLDAVLDGFDVEAIDEEENDGVTPRGEAKHWHVLHLNLRRRD